MKKTISTSIGGIVFNVEEDAHDKLAAYLDAISTSLKTSEGHDEIMQDIESRIAEILQQKISAYKQVITIAEVDEVIGVMGKPEDFGAATSGTNQQAYTYSGDPSGRRRIYRDMDDKVLFGVCSGISHHFGIDPLWMRLALGLAFFFGGFGFILYILLAIILPKARTTAEKLEMMGEPVDVNNIRKTIEEDMEHIKSNLKNFGQEVKSGKVKERAHDLGKDISDFFNSVGHGAGTLFVGILKGILGFVAFIISVVLIALLVGLIISLTSGINIHMGGGDRTIHYSVHTFFNMLSVSGGMRDILITGVFLFLGVPLLALIVRFGRIAMGRKQPFQWFTITAGILWTLSWIFMIIGIAAVSSHFSVRDFTRKEAIVNPAPNKMLYVKLNAKGEGQDMVLQLDSLNVFLSDDDEFRGGPALGIANSPDSNYHLILTRTSHGTTKAEADEFADCIDYNYTMHDSTLVLDHFFTLDVSKGWRKQMLDVTIQVPQNKSIALPDGWDYVAMHHKRGEHLGGQKWTMGQEGLVPYTK